MRTIRIFRIAASFQSANFVSIVSGLVLKIKLGEVFHQNHGPRMVPVIDFGH